MENQIRLLQLAAYKGGSLFERRVDHNGCVAVPVKLLDDLLKPVLALVRIDETWYRKNNPDVLAVEQTTKISLKDHFCEFGFFEGRMPYRIVVDERFYLETYPDIAAGVKEGTIPSAQAHFEQYGFREGREPFENWSLVEALLAKEDSADDAS